jgi:hypothetical protein
MEPLEKFKMTLDIRNMEIHLFWTRSNFFLALNTAVAAGFFSIAARPTSFAVLGFVSSLLWLFVNLGSKFWQARWEEKLREVEADAFPDMKMFTQSYEEIRASVERSVKRQSRSLFGRIVTPAILWKPSVSTMVIYLSAAFCVFWTSHIIKKTF